MALWGVVLLRLLLPFSFPSTFSVYTLFGRMGEEELPENLQWAADMLWSIHYTCPDDAEYIEGIGRLLIAMCENFRIVPRDGEMSEEAQAVGALALDFWEAYLAGDEESMRGYLAEADETFLESFPDGVDGHVAAQARVMSVKGLENAEGKLLGERCELWVEFWPNEGADSLEYLTLGCVKGQAGWKVEAYGLEM